MKLFINTLLFLAITNLYAQNSLHGIVTDASTNQGIIHASVYFVDIEKGTSTDEKGSYKIENLPAGNYKLLVSILGYETKSVNINIPKTTVLNIRLNSSAIEMEAVIISTPFHKLQSENVMKVEHQTVENLKTSGAVNLSEGITNIPGVGSITTGLSIGKPVIRGLSSNRVLVYTQGVRLENQQYGGEHGLGLSDSGIESVEVIKGPASLLYGSDALGGVLYLNPEKFANSNSSHADFNGNYFSGTQGYNTNVGYKSSDDAFKFLFRGSLAEHSDYNTDKYRATNTRFREQDFKAGMGYQKNNLKTEFRYNVNNSKLGIPDGIGEQSTLRTPLMPYQNITNHIFSSKSTVFLNNSRLDISLGYIYNDRKEFENHHDHDHSADDHDEEEEGHDHDHDHDHEHDYEGEILEAALHMKLKTANYDVRYNLPNMGKFETIIAVQGMNQVNGNYGEEQLIPDATTNDIGILATSHIHFETVDVQLGARFDNRNIKVVSGSTKEFNSFNGALGAKTNLSDFITARVNLATGFRAPNLSELYSNGSHGGAHRYEIGNPDLKSEQNIQTDIALEFKSRHVEFFVNGFYNNINNYIYLSPDGTTTNDDPVFIYLQNDAKLYGGEVGLHIHPHPIHWLHIESSFENVTGKQTDNSYLPLIPANTLTNILRVEFEKPWIKKGYSFVKMITTFKQNHVSGFEIGSPGYSLLSAGIGGSFKLFNNEATVTVSGTNLTNKTYINHLSRLKADNIYNMGRNINVGLSYNL